MNGSANGHREKSAKQFARKSDRVRVILLGCLLIIFSIIDFLNMTYGEQIPSFTIGASSAFFSGLTIVIIISKISKPHIYFDWLLNGAFEAIAGASIHAQGISFPIPPSAISSTFLALSSLTRLWIGLKIFPHSSGYWLPISGCIGIFAVSCQAIPIMTNYTSSADMLLAGDVLFQGFCIVGFGLAIRVPQSGTLE